jgi:L-alanine-DL-glutamate epimerase-like enolase superfamily enzyme
VVQTILEQEIKPVLIGKDPAFPKRLRADLWKATEYQGVQGLGQFAIAAADIAIWDILGKAAGLPVYKMLGAYADRVPAYSMCGWYYENDSDLSQFKLAIAAPRSRMMCGASRPHSRWPGKGAASWWMPTRPSI